MKKMILLLICVLIVCAPASATTEWNNISGIQIAGNSTTNGTLLLSDNTIILDDPVFDSNVTVMFDGSETLSYATQYLTNSYSFSTNNDYMIVTCNVSGSSGYVACNTPNISTLNIDFDEPDKNYFQVMVRSSGNSRIGLVRVYLQDGSFVDPFNIAGSPDANQIYNLVNNDIRVAESNNLSGLSVFYYFHNFRFRPITTNTDTKFYIDWIIATNDTTLRSGDYRLNGEQKTTVQNATSGKYPINVGFNGTLGSNQTVKIYINTSSDGVDGWTGKTLVTADASNGVVYAIADANKQQYYIVTYELITTDDSETVVLSSMNIQTDDTPLTSSIDRIVLYENRDNESYNLIVEFSNYTGAVAWINTSWSGTESGHIYHWNYWNGTEISSQTATSDNETLWFNHTVDEIQEGKYYISETSTTIETFVVAAGAFAAVVVAGAAVVSRRVRRSISGFWNRRVRRR